MASSEILLPGDEIPSERLPSNPKKALSIGPGLRHIPPSTISATSAGSLSVDWRRNAAWIDVNGGRVCVLRRGSIKYQLTSSAVHSLNQRPGNRAGQRYLRRGIQLPAHPLYAPCGPSTPSIPGCHQKNPSSAFYWSLGLRTHRYSGGASDPHRPRIDVYRPLDR